MASREPVYDTARELNQASRLVSASDSRCLRGHMLRGRTLAGIKDIASEEYNKAHKGTSLQSTAIF